MFDHMYMRWIAAFLLPITLLAGVILGIQLATGTELPINDLLFQVSPILMGFWLGLVCLDMLVYIITACLSPSYDDYQIDRIRGMPGDINILLVRNDAVIGEYSVSRLSKKARAEWQVKLSGMLRGWLGKKSQPTEEIKA